MLRSLSISMLLLALLAPLAGRAQSVNIIDPMDDMTHILGSAQMDQDPAEEIAVFFDDPQNERLVIVDSYSGAVEFDSDGYGWSGIMPPGYNRAYSNGGFAGHNRGNEVFVDDDGDGIFCLMTLISQGSLYEQQLAVICLRQPPTSIAEDVPDRQPSLHQNHPNPFNPSTTIDYFVAGTGRTKLRIYDARGALIRTLIDEVQPAGSKSVDWDGTDDSGRRVASGTYFYQLETDGRMMSKKSVLVR